MESPMISEPKQSQVNVKRIMLGIVLGAMCTSVACGVEELKGARSQERASPGRDNDLPAVIARVQSSVLQIRVKGEGPDARGIAFVVDPSGLIATSYHLIQRAKANTAVLLDDKDKHPFRVEGWTAIQPGEGSGSAKGQCRREETSAAVVGEQSTGKRRAHPGDYQRRGL